MSFFQIKKNLQEIKGAMKLYFTQYSCVVITLFNTGLYESVFSTFSFGKLVFSSFYAFGGFCLF